ncbi:MAG: hypothetical protein ACLSUW_08415 [Akkermansia sp.]
MPLVLEPRRATGQQNPPMPEARLPADNLRSSRKPPTGFPLETGPRRASASHQGSGKENRHCQIFANHHMDKATEERLRIEAWVGDAILALYVREWILAEEGAINGRLFVEFTSNDFVRRTGNATGVEAEIGRMFKAEGLEAAYAWIEQNLRPRMEERWHTLRRSSVAAAAMPAAGTPCPGTVARPLRDGRPFEGWAERHRLSFPPGHGWNHGFRYASSSVRLPNHLFTRRALDMRAQALNICMRKAGTGAARFSQHVGAPVICARPWPEPPSARSAVSGARRPMPT